MNISTQAKEKKKNFKCLTESTIIYDRNFPQTRNRMNFVNPIKGNYRKPTNIISNSERRKLFSENQQCQDIYCHHLYSTPCWRPQPEEQGKNRNKSDKK